ncbi:hypothetical protein [Streptomyces siamensis]|uniref:hypothetical protein n=1 Tax=Streptomyces siamensis TaxID=1274986 RepID=UPI0031EA24F2
MPDRLQAGRRLAGTDRAGRHLPQRLDSLDVSLVERCGLCPSRFGQEAATLLPEALRIWTRSVELGARTKI